MYGFNFVPSYGILVKAMWTVSGENMFKLWTLC